MAKLQTLSKRDLSNGIIQKIDNAIAPLNCVKFAMNLRFDKVIGRAIVREGTSLIGSQIANGKNILGLYQFNTSAGSHYLLSVVNAADGTTSVLYRLDATTWTSKKTGLTKDAKMRFLTYLDVVLGINGTDAIASADGATWVTTSTNLDVGNCPKGKYGIEWKDRVYIAGVSGNADRLYYSSIPTGGAISWDGDYIDIEPMEGQGTITGLSKVPGYLLIFKERALKRWNGSSTFPDDLCKLGTPSQESIVLGSSSVFYFSAGYKESIGFYETNGDTTRKISRPIQSIVDAISSSNYSSVAGFSNGEIVMWSIGDITYDGISYSNVVIMYSTSTQTWAAFSFPTRYLIFSPYISGTDLKIIGGNNDGEVMEIFNGSSDNITGSSNIPIQWTIQYHPLEINSRGLIKDISHIVPYTRNVAGGIIILRTDEHNTFKEVGRINTDFDKVPIKTSGHTFEFGFSGSSISDNVEIIGYDILTPSITENIEQ